MSDTQANWYVVQTKPKQEARAEANLQQGGIPTLAPRIMESRRSRNGTVWFQSAPLFPNYLFARFDAEAVLTKVRLTRGVQRVVGLGEYATPVHDSIIELIRGRLAEDGFVRAPQLQPGDRIEVVDGPLRSFTGVFERHISGGERVVILLTTMGRQARVEVDTATIRATTH
jgi:transcriptional antiterminator RfaH